MRSDRTILIVASLFLGTAVSASAVVVPGGGKRKTDCSAGFEVEGTSCPTSITSTKTTVKQKASEGKCTFSVKLCINEPVSKCTPSGVINFAFKGASTLPSPDPLGGSDHLCGPTQTVEVPLKKGRKKAKVKYKVKATTSGKPDKDKLVLICLPPANNPTCTGPTCDLSGCPGVGANCAANPAGGPDQAIVTVLGEGTDLDNGWTGTSHNFPVIKDAAVTFCMCECDASTNPVCKATAPTGTGSVNGTTFGPPLPLIAGGVPVCVVNRYNGNANVRADLSTGEMCGLINLFSDVYATDPTRVCPQCRGGQCDSGARRNQACTVDGSVVVAQSLASDKNFQLSKSCPPLGSPLSTLNIGLPITTGSTTTPGGGGSKPCREREADGVPVKDNNCSGGCSQGNCTGGACVSRIADPSNPSQMICVDAKGGLSQACCNDNTSVPCFDTAPGGIGIVRTGRPVVADPAWPDPTYPKVANGLVTAAAFCEAGTGSSNIDTVTGLPGPGAVIFNNRVELQKLP